MMKTINRMVALFVALAFATAAWAKDYTWTGNGDGSSWLNPTNWGESAEIVWSAADTATFESSAEVTVDSGTASDGVLKVGSVAVKGENTVVTIHGANNSSLETTRGVSAADVGSVLNIDLPLKYNAPGGRQDLSGSGTVKFTDKFTVIGKDFYNSLRGQVYSKGTVMDATEVTGAFTMGMTYSHHIDILMEDDAVINLKSFNLGNGSASSISHRFVQDGTATRLSTTGNFEVNHDVTKEPMHYLLKDGTLSVGGSLLVTTQNGTAGGDYTQEGGTATVASDFNLNNGTAVFSNGMCTVNGWMQFGNVKDKGHVEVYNGMNLTLGALAVPVVFRAGGSSDPAVVHFTRASASGDAKLAFEPGAKVKMTADAAVVLWIDKDTVLPDDLDIGTNITIAVSLDVQLTAGSTTPPALKIRSGAKLNLSGQTTYIAAPIDLTIEEGGQLNVDAGSSQYTRGMIVAHSYTLKGVKQAVGRYTAVNNATAEFRGKANCDLYVPCTWTGAAGDNDINNTGNWENGTYSYWASTYLLDFSRATEPVVLTTAHGNEIVEAGIAYLPPKDGVRTLKLVNGTGADVLLGLKGAAAQYRGAGFCRKDCTIEFDVRVKNESGYDRNGFMGGGTFRFNRALLAEKENYFLLEGFAELGSTLAPTTAFRFFVNHDTPSDRGIIRFVDGASVTISGTLTTDNNDGFLPGHAYEQTGGTVSVADLCMTATRADAKTINTYTLGGGILTITDNLNLGGPSTQVPSKNPYSTGTFVMTGGTLNAAKISLALNQNWCKLQGGTVKLGSAGFEKANVAAFQENIPNATPGLEFGGVTFAAENSWTASSSLDVNLTGVGGVTTFDVSAGQTVTLAGAVSGVGGFVKTGEGALVLSGDYAATGDIRVESGTVSFAAGTKDATIGVLELKSADNLSLASGAQLSVGSLIVNGQRYGKGSYPFGDGNVVVAPSSAEYSWIGPAGGNWSDANNWQDGKVPNGTDVVLDFSGSSVPATIAVDEAVSLKSLHLDYGTVTLTAAENGVLTLHEGATLTVDEDTLLDIGVEIRIARVTGTNFTARVKKDGAGKVRFSGLLRSGDEPASLKFQEGAVAEVAAGELEIAGEVEGVHVYPLSNDRNVVPTVRLADGAVLTNVAWVTGVFAAYDNSSFYGAVVMDGGLVRVTHSALNVFGSNGAGRDGKGGYARSDTKNCFGWFGSGETSFTVNGGRYEVANDGVQITLMNLNNTVKNGGASTLTVNGGSVVFKTGYDLYLGAQEDCRDEVTLNGGELSLNGHLSHASGTGEKCRTFLNLNGGKLTMGGVTSIDYAQSAQLPIMTTLNGTVTIAEWQESDVLTFKTAVGGALAKIIHHGPGRLVFEDLSGLSPEGKVSVDVEGGELDLTGAEALPIDLERIDLAGTGKLGLFFTGAENAETLYVNGRQKGAGVYGTKARRATRFAGEGLLNVLTGENSGCSVILR